MTKKYFNEHAQRIADDEIIVENLSGRLAISFDEEQDPDQAWSYTGLPAPETLLKSFQSYLNVPRLEASIVLDTSSLSKKRGLMGFTLEGFDKNHEKILYASFYYDSPNKTLQRKNTEIFPGHQQQKYGTRVLALQHDLTKMLGGSKMTGIVTSTGLASWLLFGFEPVQSEVNNIYENLLPVLHEMEGLDDDTYDLVFELISPDNPEDFYDLVTNPLKIHGEQVGFYMFRKWDETATAKIEELKAAGEDIEEELSPAYRSVLNFKKPLSYQRLMNRIGPFQQKSLLEFAEPGL